MNSFSLSPIRLLAAGVVIAAAAATQAQVDPSLLQGLKWRNIGPFRGGRVSAVTGVIGQPGVFYIGLPVGGVWKTTSAGTTWYPVFDSIKEVSSIGAVQVAPSDPNVVYAGTGDQIRNLGNGMYKSIDAGQTWQHIGLEESQEIPRILVDPHDPNTVLVAALGDDRKHTDQRGVFRSTDGGQTWKRTLDVGNEIGGEDIAWAFDNPKVILATTQMHYSAPGAQGQGGGGFGRQQQTTGPVTTKLFKSTDEGETWTEISGNGLPRLFGRCCSAIAQGTNSQRMYLIGMFGLYRSDDGGANWKQMDAKDRRIGNGQGNYTSGVYVDPHNPDIVYTLATCSYKSVDGGNTFTGFKGAPGGDDPQQMWIDPTDGKRMLLGVDQGATISLDGGGSWSSWYNQPTAQVYRISVDNQYPYWVYATQQDSGSIATATRGNLGEITNMDWLPHPGYEFGSVVADPLNPKVSYAGGPGNGIIKTTFPSGQWINVSPNIDSSTERLRTGRNQLLAYSVTNPHELLAAFQYLMATTDGGEHWRKLSPDFTAPKEDPSKAKPAAKGAKKPASGGSPFIGGQVNEEEDEDDDTQRGGGGGAIDSFTTSSVNPGVIWAGTTNGLVRVTKDGGKTWQEANIPDIANLTRPDIVYMDSSHQDAAEAYAVVNIGGGSNDPLFYRTRDYGKTWSKIVSGMPTDQVSGGFGRCIKADTKKSGLLFAGTESAMYVSFDDGDHWQSLMLNLPNTSYRDIAIHDNDLVVGTYGRSFWVLDDYSPLSDITPGVASEGAHLFKPGDAIRVRRNVNGDTPFPPEVPHAVNPPLGAVIYYTLGSKPQGPISLEISDSAGNVVRHLSSVPPTPFNEPPSAVPDFWLQPPSPMPTEVGLNRINWNIRYDDPPALSHNVAQVMGATPYDTPYSPEGPLALPGTYTAKLIVDGKSYTQTFVVKNDPRSPASASDLRAQHDLQMQLYEAAKEAYDGYEQVAAMRTAVAQIKSSSDSEVSGAASDFDDKLAAVGGSMGFGRGFGGGGFGGSGQAPDPTFARVNSAMQRELDTLDFGDLMPNEAMFKAYAASAKDLKAVVTNWNALKTKDLAAFNATLSKHNVTPIAMSLPDLSVPVSHNRSGNK